MVYTTWVSTALMLEAIGNIYYFIEASGAHYLHRYFCCPPLGLVIVCLFSRCQPVSTPYVRQTSDTVMLQARCTRVAMIHVRSPVRAMRLFEVLARRQGEYLPPPVARQSSVLTRTRGERSNSYMRNMTTHPPPSPIPTSFTLSVPPRTRGPTTI